MALREGFETGKKDLTDGNIHFRRAGSGDPLVFVHGWGVNGDLWDAPARLLAADHECIVPDLPLGGHVEGFNPSADLSAPGVARILAEFLEAMDLENATLIGNDSGGAVAQVTVTSHPERVGRLVLTNCDCFEVFPPGTFKLMGQSLRLPGAMTVLANSLRSRLMQRSNLAFGGLSNVEISDEMLDSWLRPMIEKPAVRRDAREFGRQMDPAVTQAAAERFGAVEIPVLIAWGRDDRFFKPQLAERLRDELPNAELTWIDGARTFVSLDQPEALADEIRSWTARHPLP